MKKLLVLSAAAALVAVQTANAVPTLVLTDSLGNTTGIITDGGAGDGNPLAGVITFSGVVGNWNINVTTGIASPPSPGHTASNPNIDLSSVNHFNGGLGGKLTITFLADGLGPISGMLTHTTGGTLNTGMNDEFFAKVNGNNVTDEKFTALGYNGSQTAPVTVGTGSTIGIVAVLTANGTAAGQTSFDSEVSTNVPDAGMTLALLGSGLAGLALFARSRKTA